MPRLDSLRMGREIEVIESKFDSNLDGVKKNNRQQFVIRFSMLGAFSTGYYFLFHIC